MNDNHDLRISRYDLKALEDLAELLQRNYDTAEQNLYARRLRLQHAISVIDNIKAQNGI